MTARPVDDLDREDETWWRILISKQAAIRVEGLEGGKFTPIRRVSRRPAPAVARQAVSAARRSAHRGDRREKDVAQPREWTLLRGVRSASGGPCPFLVATGRAG